MTQGQLSTPGSAWEQGSAAVYMQHSCQCINIRHKHSILKSKPPECLLNRNGAPADLDRSPIISPLLEFPASLALVHITTSLSVTLCIRSRRGRSRLGQSLSPASQQIHPLSGYLDEELWDMV